jgi:hypothetical protein
LTARAMPAFFSPPPWFWFCMAELLALAVVLIVILYIV